MRKPRTLGEALEQTMGHLHNMYPSVISEAEHQAMKRAEVEHGKDIAVRMNPTTFRVEYYNRNTGEIVSSHI